MMFKEILKMLLVITFIIISYLAGTHNVDKTSIEKKGYDAGYDVGYNFAWDKAAKLVDSIQTPIIPQINSQSTEMLSISAKIESISASDFSLVVKAYPVSSNPLSKDSKPTLREIKTNSETKIVKLTSKTPEEIQEEITKKSEETFVPITPVSPFSEKEITFDQLKVGDMIIIFSDKNIKKETEIAPVKITVQWQPAIEDNEN